MLVHEEGVTVIAIEAISGGKPHEAPAILQNGSNIALREAIVRGEVGKFEVPHPSMATLSLGILVPEAQVSSPFALPTEAGLPPRAVDILLREMLTRRWFPADTANAIEANQPEFRSEPEIPVRRLGHRVDVAQGKPVPGGPNGLRVLADIERRSERERGSAADQRGASQ